MLSCNRNNQQLAESSHWFPDPWCRGYFDKKEPNEHCNYLVCTKIENQKQYYIPGRIEEISATSSILKAGGVMVSVISHFSSPIWPVQKTGESWIMTWGYCKLNQELMPVSIPDVSLLLENQHLLAPDMQLLNWHSACFSLYLLVNIIQWSSVSSGRAVNTLLWPQLRAAWTFQSSFQLSPAWRSQHRYLGFRGKVMSFSAYGITTSVKAASGFIGP